MKTLKQQVAHERILIDKHVTKLRALLKSCTHEETELKSHYEPGGYLDTAYTEQWNECALCGQQSAKQVTHRGGFA